MSNEGLPAVITALATAFGLQPPEVTSQQMYSGPGAESLLAAATAWDGLATELHSAATSYGSTISKLAGEGWSGPSSGAMVAAATPYASWMSGVAAQAREAATQAKAAASAYETAFTATVPPPIIAANRSQLANLLATNIFGLNTAAIAAVEAQYEQMWAQDAAAMSGYAQSAAAATRLTSFTEPPKTTNESGQAAQSAAAASTTGNSAGTSIQSLLSQASQQLSSMYTQTFTNVANVSKFDALGNVTMGATNMGMVQFKTFFHPLSMLPEIPKSGLGAGLGGMRPPLSVGLTSAVSADVGNAPVVGRLSVPPSWGTATPAIRLAVNAAPEAAMAAAPAAGAAPAALGAGALQSLAGGALGGTAPGAIRGAAFRGGAAGKRDKVPVKLDRVIKQLQERRDSVQHWQVDEAGLDDLLDELSKKPGFHAVHVAKGSKAQPAS